MRSLFTRLLTVILETIKGVANLFLRAGWNQNSLHVTTFIILETFLYHNDIDINTANAKAPPGHFTGQVDQNPGLGKGRLIFEDIFLG